MRIVAIAVSIAIVIGFSSVMFQVTARAESVDNVNALDLSAHQLGTLGAYPVIGIPTSGLLADYISTSDESGSMSMRDYFLPFVVFNGDIYYTYKDIDTGASPSAEFLSFKGTESSGLYLVDWVQAGQQYPIVDFRIDDKGNYHKYALRISGNSNYAEILKGIWDRQEMKEAASAASNAVGVFLLLKAAASLGTKAVVSIAGAATPIGALFLNVPKKDVTGYVMLAAQNKLVQEYDTLCLRHCFSTSARSDIDMLFYSVLRNAGILSISKFVMLLQLFVFVAVISRIHLPGA